MWKVSTAPSPTRPSVRPKNGGTPGSAASARSRSVVVRTWQPERDRRVVLVLDTGRTSAGRVDDQPRLDAAMDAALLLATGRPRTQPPPGALDSAILSLAFWTGAAVFSGLAFPALLGLLLYASFLARRAQLRADPK